MIETPGVYLTVFSLYFAFMIGVGWTASRKTNSPLAFFLANRNLKSWVTAISSTASSESAWAVLGTVGLAYKEGLSAIWFLPGCLLGYAVNWLLLAERLRKYSRETHALTLPDYLEGHFQDSSRTLRIVSVVIVFSCMMAYIAAQFTAVGKTFDAIFDIPHYVSVPIGAVIIVAYTMLGGFLAVVWTDFFQGLIMVIGLVILAISTIIYLGGFSEILDKIQSISPQTLEWRGGKSIPAFVGSVVGLLGIGLGYPGQPHVLNRYMAAKDSQTISRGTWIAFGWGLLIYSSAILLGVVGNVLIPGLEDPEQLFPRAAEMILPPTLSAIVLTGVLAAIMSTVSAQIIVAASSVAHDIYSKILYMELSHDQILRVSRGSILILGIGGTLVALMKTQVIFWFVLFAWSGLGASFGPLILFTLYWRRTTHQGALAGMLTGFIVTVFWKLAGWSDSIIYELVPAFLFSTLAICFVSLKTVKKSRV